VTQSIIGHNETLFPLLRRLADRQFPHAWLFEGPKGIGKATLAKMLAGVILGDGFETSARRFQMSSNAAYAKILESNHADARIIQAESAGSEAGRQQISVSEVRQLTSFFELQASQGGYRVCVLDSLDELNKNGANALLKTLEEPPKDSVLILIYHGTTPLLPTIRSRCVSLKFSRLSVPELTEIANGFEGDPITEDMLDLCEGSPGQLQIYQDANIAPMLAEIKKHLIDAWPDISSHRLTRLTSLLSSSEKFQEIGLGTVRRWLSSCAQSADDAETAGRYSACWEALVRTSNRGKLLRLDLTEQSAANLSVLLSLSKNIR
tara:strand:+ start:1952 stop:2914 length:963 start_codon:yes stop_codon:yes gene_type:complete